MKKNISIKLNYISKTILFICISIGIKSCLLLASLYSLNIFTIGYNFLATFISIVFFISFSFLLSNRKQVIYLIIMDFLISILFLIDILYSRSYAHLFSPYLMLVKNATNEMSASIISLLSINDILFFIDIPILIVIYNKFKHKTNTNWFEKNRIFFFLITFILSSSLMAIQFIRLEKEKLLGNSRLISVLMSPIGSHIYDLYRFSYDRTMVLTKDEISEIESWMKANEKYQEPSSENSSLEGILKGKNLIAIQVESLENFVIDKSFYGEEITPNINKLLKNSFYFNNIHEQVNDGNSSDAELMFNTSTYPIDTGSAFLRFGDNKYNSLPGMLKGYGYTSMAVHGDYKQFWNRDVVYKTIDFDIFISEEKFQYKDIEGMGIKDEDLFSQTILEMGKLKPPFNLFLITLTSHMPFDISKDLRDPNLPYTDESDKYLQSIHYMDKSFGEFYEILKKKGYLDNSVIVIYGDHEGIHKYYKTSLPENDKRIPFIIYVPGMKGSTINKTGGQIDILPTLTYLMGINKDENKASMMGSNLFNVNAGAAILQDGNIIGSKADVEHLQSAQNIANLIVKGNYYNSSKDK